MSWGVIKHKHKKSKVELINTIEINPFAYANIEYEYPNGSSKDLPDEWYKFWKKCLADKNLDNLEPIRKGSYLVDINSISNLELKEILKCNLKDFDPDDFEEQVSRIYGGVVIKIENEFVIEPTCCGDIGNLYEWEKIFGQLNQNWTELWIGHPWIYYRIENGEVEFSDYYEANFADIKDMKSLLKLPFDDLRKKLAVIKKEQDTFGKRIQNALEEMEIKNAGQIAQFMTGNK